MTNFTNKLTFQRGDNKLVVDIEYEDNRLSISGIVYEKNNHGSWRDVGGGQCQDELIQNFVDMPNAKRLYELWERWHLNDLNAGDEVQEAHLRKLKENGWEYKSYENACEQLERDGLLVHNGYKYGSAWKFEEVPAEVLKELEGMEQ